MAEKTGLLSSVTITPEKASAQSQTPSKEEDDTILKLKAEPVGVKDDQAAVDALTLPLQQTIIAQHDKAKPAPASEDYPTDIAYQLITDVQKANDALNQLVDRQEIVGLDLVWCTEKATFVLSRPIVLFWAERLNILRSPVTLWLYKGSRNSWFLLVSD